MFEKSKTADAAISNTFDLLPFYLLKLQNLYEETCYQFLFVVKKAALKHQISTIRAKRES